MHRTLLGDLECFGTLLLVERPVQSDLALDPVEQALFGLAFGAVDGVDSRVAEPHRHALERPPFPSRIQRDGHGRSGAEGGQQQIVRAGPAVGPTGGDGLVGDEPVAPDGDLLDESLRAAAHDHQALLQWLDHDVTSCDRLKELTSLPALRVLTPPSPRGPHPLSPSPQMRRGGTTNRVSMSEDSKTVPHDSLERRPRAVPVPHVDHAEASGFEHLRAGSVVCSLVRSVVRVALQLQDEPLGGAIEVDDKPAQHVLAAEFEAEYAALA